MSVCAVREPTQRCFVFRLGDIIIYLHIFLGSHGYLGSFMLGAAMNLAAVNITLMGLSWHMWVYVSMRVLCF